MRQRRPHRPGSLLFFLVAGLILVAGVDARAQALKKGQRLADYFGFQPLEIYKLEHRIANLTLRDLDGDHVQDIAVSNNARSRIELFLSTKKTNEDDANRPFRKDPNDLSYDRRMRQVPIPVNKEIVSLDSGDFNNDGKPDLVFYGTPAEIHILFNEGEGRFGNVKKITSGEGVERASALSVGDLDQDGRDDIVLLSDHELSFIYQKTPGVLSEPERVPHTAENPWLVRILDLDGDGAKDLVIAGSAGDQPIHIRFATPDRKLGPEQRFAVEMFRAIAFGAVDNRPGSEILTIENQSGRARILSLDPSANDEADKRGRLVYFGLPQGAERGRSLALVDLDGDGRQDIVVTDPANAQTWAYLQSGQSGLGAGLSFPSLVGAQSVHVADLDGDRKDEVYVLSDKEKQIGRSVFVKGRLTFPSPLPASGEPVGMDLADLNGDKSPEILYVSRTRPKPSSEVYELRALARGSDGTFHPFKWGDLESVALPAIKSAPAAIESLDFNADGLPDLMIFNEYGTPLILIGRKGEAPAPLAGGLGPLTGASPTSISEMNLDGPALFVAQNSFARRIALDPKGNWLIKDQYNSGRNGATIQGAAAIDTDGDGVREIVLLDRSSKSLLFLSKKDGVYRPDGTLSIGPINFQGLHVADLNGDGRDDLLIAGSDRFAVLQTGQKGLRLKTIASYESKRNEARLSDLAAGDVNGDGVTDVVFVDIGEQSMEIASFAGDKDLIPATHFRVFERKTFRNMGDMIEPRDLALGDVNGDGRTDIVIIVHDRVIVYRQDPGPAIGEKKPVASASARK